MKILVIDDSKMIKLLVRDFLTKLGHEVLEAENGMKGFELLGRENVDLIMLDYNMPELDGPGFLRKYKVENNGKVPVIMMTTENSLEKITEVLNLGAAEYVMKPFDQDILKEKIAMVMNL